MRGRLMGGLLAVGCLVFAGCMSSEKAKDEDFHTSGSPEADQRAEETVAKTQQLRGEGLNESETRRSLYERLGKDAGLQSIVSDWVDRMLADPRVNFKRVGIKSGGVLGVGGKSETWNPTPESIAEMKKHFVQSIALSIGGPAYYDGKDLKGSHSGMAITNAEFDAGRGDLIAAMDAHRVRTQEQKELLAIVESTRPHIVSERE